ncbi:nuclear transcription factor Y subunit A-7 isoform X3 [Nicotiana tabacum]|uniref:Nuclear transcription factor Y subunit A-7 isoform X3 n=1 Tax=Nicotiana tabacum TaxID=4097 RepID=A0AC58T1T0_TOBAC
MTSSLHYHSDGSENEQPEKQSEAHSESSSPATGMSVPGIATPNMHYVMPTQLGNGNAMLQAQTAYPYPDPYYRSIFAPYDAQPYPTQPYPAQPMVHVQLMGIQQAGVPLPSDAIDEPVFVNAKQYHGILRRRQSRAKAESEKKLLKARKLKDEYQLCWTISARPNIIQLVMRCLTP